MEKMKGIGGEETLIKVFWNNRWLLCFLLTFSSNFVFGGIFYLICFSYIVELLLRSDQTERGSNDDEDDEHKEVKKILTDMEQIHSDISESLSKECGEIREELNIHEKTMMTRLDLMVRAMNRRMRGMEHLFYTEMGYVKANLRLDVVQIEQELRDNFICKVNEGIKASMQKFNKDVNSVANSLHSVIQETAKEAKTISTEDIKASRETFNEDVKVFAEQLHETCLVIEKTAKEVNIAGETYLNFQKDLSKRGMMISGEDVEREEVLRLSIRDCGREALTCDGDPAMGGG